MKKIPFIKPGDTIGIAATARKISENEIFNAIRFLTDQGFKVKFASNLFMSHHQFAGDDEQRIIGIQELLDDDDVKAIINARGGYGTARIIDRINFNHFVSKPKWLCGFSDFTVALAHVFSLYDLSSMHSPMMISMNNDDALRLTSFRLIDALQGKPIRFSFPVSAYNNSEGVDGILFGGNLSVLYSIMGSSSLRLGKDIILFVEDLDEYMYHIDRMMVGLMRAGVLQNVKALVVGAMTEMHDNSVAFGKNASEIIYENADRYRIPLIFNFPVGHINNQQTVIVGRSCRFEVHQNSIEFSQLIVEDIC